MATPTTPAINAETVEAYRLASTNINNCAGSNPEKSRSAPPAQTTPNLPKQDWGASWESFHNC